MRKLARTCSVALMLNCMAGNVMAATQVGCIRPDEMVAIKAAIQQRLILAALSCNTTHCAGANLLFNIAQRLHRPGSSPIGKPKPIALAPSQQATVGSTRAMSLAAARIAHKKTVD
jgi:hypothetical protein